MASMPTGSSMVIGRTRRVVDEQDDHGRQHLLVKRGQRLPRRSR